MGTRRIDVPERPQRTPLQTAVRALKGAALYPIYWTLAHRYDVPGLAIATRCARLGLRLAVTRRAPVPGVVVYELLFRPLDSTRHFEFDFMWRGFSTLAPQGYLDISSPRCLPMLVLERFPSLVGDLLNPDPRDLDITRQVAAASGLSDRCRFHDQVIEAAPLRVTSFDLITCMSVLEHIPEDGRAVARMWDLLRPGGHLLITVPCARVTSEQVISTNEYGVLETEQSGYVFWQRFYDEAALRERIFPVTGPPRRFVVYGEKRPGAFQENAHEKRSDPNYPFWREPVMMGQEYRIFDTIDALPGEGVVGMEFVKP